MDIPQSAEGISRLLRSKTISTAEIYDISTKLIDGSIEVYFPQKEAFVLQLLVDRWNDHKIIAFKTDSCMWKLFNVMWKQIHSEEHKKRIFKNLKFIPHLMQTLQLIDSNVPEFISTLAETLSLINSSVTIDVVPEQAQMILACILNMLVDNTSTDSQLRSKAIGETINLTNFSETKDITVKTSKSFAIQLLYPILRYSTHFSGTADEEITQKLEFYIGDYIFSSPAGSMDLIEVFLNSSGSELAADELQTFFDISVHFLSNTDFSLLESIFTSILTIHPSLASNLLKKLSESKKTMSQSFLEGLFDKVFNDSSASNFDNTWILINHITDLDIEVGILNTQKIMDKLSKENVTPITVSVWSQLVKCHVNAREFAKFLSIWERYPTVKGNSNCFLSNPEYAMVISKNVRTLSTTQIRDTMDRLLSVILANNRNSEIAIQALTIIIKGLQDLSYEMLPEFRLTIARIFDFDDYENPGFWDMFYHVLDTYDDILPPNKIEKVQQAITACSNGQQPPSNLFFSIFKFRELVEFDMDSTAKLFISFVVHLEPSEQYEILKQVLQRWSTIINSFFPKMELKQIVNILTTLDNGKLIMDLMKDEDFFEEDNIMYQLVEIMLENLDDVKWLKTLGRIPIQCINKNNRVRALNDISRKSDLREPDISLLSHLLTNPTFKSALETDIIVLRKLVDTDEQTYSFSNKVYETVIINHLSQIKEKSSCDFVVKLITFLTSCIKNDFDFTAIKMAFYLVKVSPAKTTAITALGENLIEAIIKKLKGLADVISENSNLFSWLLKALFYVSPESSSHADGQIRGIVESLAKLLLTSSNFDLDVLANFFLLYCTVYEDELSYLLAHYLVLRQKGIEHAKLISGVKFFIQHRLLEDPSEAELRNFNNGFVSMIHSFQSIGGELTEALFEIYEVIIENLTKENNLGTKLFCQSISELFTHFQTSVINHKSSFLHVLECLNTLLTTKPWLFSQHCIESLFPMCLKFNLISITDCDESDDVFVLTNRLLSNVLLYHRYKLSNRHHLIVSNICILMDLVVREADSGLTDVSARALARFITNFCEPSNLAKSNKAKETFNSRVAQAKKSLRKYLPVVLIKYINLSLVCPIKPLVKQELVAGIFSILDLLSRDELEIVNVSLDNSGRSYYRALYGEYKRVGKWRDS